jgi:hypothetical protein
MGSSLKKRFETLAQLRLHFMHNQRHGELTGYVIDKKRKPGELDYQTTKAWLVFWYADQHTLGENEFADVLEMVKFFENPEHVALAKCVRYVKKK